MKKALFLLVTMIISLSSWADGLGKYLTASEIRDNAATLRIAILNVTTTGGKYINGEAASACVSSDGTLASVTDPTAADVLVLESTGSDNQYYLKRESDNQYLNCAAGGNFTLSETASTTWGVYGKDDDGFGTVSGYDDIFTDIDKSLNDNMIRFIANSQYMNGQAYTATGGLRGGTGAWSINYVRNADYKDPTYYIKHNFPNGWEWKQLTADAGATTYSLKDVYGGTGCNWNTTADDATATWIESPTLSGDPISGDSCKFTLDPTAGTITITFIGEEHAAVKYYLKSTWDGSTDWTWKEMTKQEDGSYTLTTTYSGNGVNYNTSENDFGSTWVESVTGSEGLTTADDVVYTLTPGESVTLTVAKVTPTPTTPVVRNGKSYSILDGIYNQYWSPSAATVGENYVPSDTPHYFAVTLDGEKATFVDQNGYYLGGSGWNAVSSESSFEWTVASVDDGNYSLYQDNTSYPGYAGGQSGKSKVYINNSAAIALTFTPIFKLTYKFVNEGGQSLGDDQVAYLNTGDAYPAYTLPEGATYKSGAPEEGKTVADADADDEVYTIVCEGGTVEKFAVTYTFTKIDEENDLAAVYIDGDEGNEQIASGTELEKGTKVYVQAVTTDPTHCVTVKVAGKEVALTDNTYDFTLEAETAIDVTFEKNVLTLEEGKKYYIKELSSGLFVQIDGEASSHMTLTSTPFEWTIAGGGSKYNFGDGDGSWIKGGASGWNISIAESAYNWTIAGANDSFTMGCPDNGKYIGADALTEGSKLYYDKATALNFKLIATDEYDPKEEIIAALQAAIQTAKDNIGTDVTYYDETKANEAIAAAQAAIDDEARTAETLTAAKTALEEALKTAVIVPEAGKIYQFNKYGYYQSSDLSVTNQNGYLLAAQNVDYTDPSTMFKYVDGKYLVSIATGDSLAQTAVGGGALTTTSARANASAETTAKATTIKFVCDVTTHTCLVAFNDSTRFAYGANSAARSDAGSNPGAFSENSGYCWTVNEVGVDTIPTLEWAKTATYQTTDIEGYPTHYADDEMGETPFTARVEKWSDGKIRVRDWFAHTKNSSFNAYVNLAFTVEGTQITFDETCAAFRDYNEAKDSVQIYTGRTNLTSVEVDPTMAIFSETNRALIIPFTAWNSDAQAYGEDQYTYYLTWEADPEPTGISSVTGAYTNTLSNGKYIQNGRVVIVNNGKKYNAAGQTVK